MYSKEWEFIATHEHKQQARRLPQSGADSFSEADHDPPQLDDTADRASTQ